MGPHRSVLRVVGGILIFMGAVLLLNVVLLPLTPGVHGVNLAVLLQMTLNCAIWIGAGALLYAVAPNLME